MGGRAGREAAREQVQKIIGATAKEISSPRRDRDNNLAIKGIAEMYKERGITSSPR